MLSLLGLGMAAQLMQQCGCKRLAPVLTLTTLLVISVGSMISLTQLLEAEPDWQVASASDRTNSELYRPY